MDVSQNTSIDPNAHFSKTLPYQPTHLRTIDYVILTVSYLGIMGNLVSLMVWRTHKTYNPVIFLFKYLAVVDIKHLVSISFWRIFVLFRRYFSDHTYFTVLFTAYGTELLGQALSLHTTLLIAVCRFIVVSRPLEVYNGTLLTRCQVIIACVVLFFWCLLLIIPFIVMTLLIFNDKIGKENVSYYFPVIFIFCEFSVTTLLMIVFDVLLLKKLRSSTALRSSPSSSHSEERRYIGRRVTVVVVLMSVCSILAYLITGTCVALAFIYLHYTQEQSTGTSYLIVDILAPTYEFLESLNSSINIIFYLAFFQNFRKVSPTAGTIIDVTESSIPMTKTMN
ncbi:FMRFamide receptor-like [Pomacea canaliculata]|uniref:FMRFamide receptor-like n=1 Tax=Pomacea canaliculata TaxID=400727 RepID=UPI000D73E3CE|nr:FMRFamide receptor-like [Pomacea canaliculata]XP_025110898.1 FMRFamide receptor-like [Pomacea canaliculata]